PLEARSAGDEEEGQAAIARETGTSGERDHALAAHPPRQDAGRGHRCDGPDVGLPGQELYANAECSAARHGELEVVNRLIAGWGQRLRDDVGPWLDAAEVDLPVTILVAALEAAAVDDVAGAGQTQPGRRIE